MPLLLETLILCTAAYLIGVAIAWMFFGRKTSEGYA